MASVLQRLKHALHETGMMNSLFIEQIQTGKVSDTYVSEAFSEFRKAMNPPPIKVAVQYVVGFVFSADASRALLIFKKRPAWQNGLLNGIGGKIEDGELPLDAMCREFTEETFVTTQPDWQLVGTRRRAAIADYQPGSYEMHVFAAFVPDVRAFVYDVELGKPAHSELALPSFPKIDWKIPKKIYKTHEDVIALPLNREILARRGVPGLAWIVDASLQGLREHFLFEVEDPVQMDYLDD